MINTLAISKLDESDKKTNNEGIIALHTSEFMNTARHIYEKMGFKAVKELAPHYVKK